jgi:hypothetical protein
MTCPGDVDARCGEGRGGGAGSGGYGQIDAPWVEGTAWIVLARSRSGIWAPRGLQDVREGRGAGAGSRGA